MSGFVPSFSEPLGSRNRYKTQRVFGVSLFLFASALFMFYCIAFPLTNMKVPHGFTSPNNWRSSRYTFTWWMVYLASLNLLLPMLLICALVDPDVPEIIRTHHFLSWCGRYVNFGALIVVCAIWALACNNGYWPSSLCNDARYCCAHYNDNDDVKAWCPNRATCSSLIGYDFSAGNMHRNDEWFQVCIGYLFFTALSFANQAINRNLRRDGVLKI